MGAKGSCICKTRGRSLECCREKHMSAFRYIFSNRLTCIESKRNSIQESNSIIRKVKSCHPSFDIDRLIDSAPTMLYRYEDLRILCITVIRSGHMLNSRYLIADSLQGACSHRSTELQNAGLNQVATSGLITLLDIAWQISPLPLALLRAPHSLVFPLPPVYPIGTELLCRFSALALRIALISMVWASITRCCLATIGLCRVRAGSIRGLCCLTTHELSAFGIAC